MNEMTSQYYRIANVLHLMGFTQSKHDQTVFSKPYELKVRAQIVDQDEDEEYEMKHSLCIYLRGDEIVYEYAKFCAHDSGRLVKINIRTHSKFDIEDFCKEIREIFADLYASPVYEVCGAPFYEPSTIMHVTAFKLFGDKVIEERKIDPDISAKFV